MPHAGFRKHALARLILPGRGLQIILALFRAGGKALQDRHRYHFAAGAQRHTAHTGGGAGDKLAHIIHGEADGLAALGGQEHIIGLVAQRHADQPVIIAFFKADGELARGRHAGETVHGVAAHATMRRGKHHVQAAPFGLVLRQRQRGDDRFAIGKGKQIVDRLALGLRAAHRQAPHLQAIDLAGRGEEQHRIVGGGDKQRRHRIFVLGAHGVAALAAAALRPILGQRHALDPAIAGHGHHHVLALDQILVVDVLGVEHQFGAALGLEFIGDIVQLGIQHGTQAHTAGQDVEQIGNGIGQFLQFTADFIAAQRGELVEAQIKDGAHLQIRKPDGGRVHVHRAGFDQRQIGANLGRIPITRHQRFTGFGRAGAGADDAHDFVQVGDRNHQADQQVGPFACLHQFVLRTAGDDLLTELHKGVDDVLHAHQFRASATNGQHVEGKTLLRRRVAPQLVQHHVRRRIALQIEHDAHAFAIGFIAQVRHALDALVLHRFGDLFHQRVLALLVGNFGQHDGALLAAAFFHHVARTDADAAAPGFIGLFELARTQDDAAGGEIRGRQVVHQAFNADHRIGQPGPYRIDHFAQIVRRNIGRHAHGDAAGTIDQQVGEARRQHGRFLFGTVIVGDVINRVLLDIGEQRFGRFRQPRFGIAHGRRGIRVHRAKVALAVDQRQPHRPILHHARQRIVNRAVTVRVIFAHHVADDAGRFAIGLAVGEAVFVTAPQDAPVHRFQAIAHIRQRPRNDDRHGIIKETRPHFRNDGNRLDVGFTGGGFSG